MSTFSFLWCLGLPDVSSVVKPNPIFRNLFINSRDSKPLTATLFAKAPLLLVKLGSL